MFQEASYATIDKTQAILCALTRQELDGAGASFDGKNLIFQMLIPQNRDVPDKKLHAINAKRDKLIKNAEKPLQKSVKLQIIFAIDWRIV